MDKPYIYQQKDYAEEYDEDRYGGAFGRYLHDLELNTFLSLVDLSCKNVLDVGAGTGKLCIPLSLKYERVTGIDFSSKMIQVALRKAEKGNLILNIVVCDAHRLCFRDKTFDCVISSRLLMHLNDWRKGIAELCRVSRNEVVLDFPSVISLGALDSIFKKCMKFFVPSTQTYSSFLARKVADEFLSYDFETVVTKKEFFVPFAFHRWLENPSLSSKIESVFRIIGLTELFGGPVTLKAKRISREC